MDITFTSQIRNTISKYRMLGAEDRVLVGVSGGADSVCLLLVLRELGHPAAAAHLNHGIRGMAADEDELFTRELAERLNVDCFVKRVSLAASRASAVEPRLSREGVPGTVPRTGNIEAAGRKARKAFFKETMEEYGFTKLAVAHTRDDRIETFLMNLFRGAGMEGLVSMPPVSERTVRPLIETNRAEVESYLRQRGQPWRTDATNFDLSLARNRLRHAVIPELASEFNRNLVEALSRTIHILEAEDAWMHDRTEEWIEKHGAATAEGLVLDCRALLSEPAGLIRRVIRAALRREGSSLQNVSFDHIEAVRSLLDGHKSGKIVEIPGRLVVAREFERLVVRTRECSAEDYEYELQIPGHVHIPELRKTFRAEVTSPAANQWVEGSTPSRALVDAASLGSCVKIRNWKLGDYYRPVGSPSGKLKKLFQRARIPRSLRRSWPVVVTDSSIVWVASFPVSRDFASGGDTQKIVVLEALPG